MGNAVVIQYYGIECTTNSINHPYYRFERSVDKTGSIIKSVLFSFACHYFTQCLYTIFTRRNLLLSFLH